MLANLLSVLLSEHPRPLYLESGYTTTDFAPALQDYLHADNASCAAFALEPQPKTGLQRTTIARFLFVSTRRNFSPNQAALVEFGATEAASLREDALWTDEHS